MSISMICIFIKYLSFSCLGSSLVSHLLSFVWVSFACSRLETLFGSQSVLKRRSLPGKVLVRGCGGTGRSWRYIGQRASSFVVKVLCREGLSLTTAIIYSKKRKPAVIHADLKDEQDWRHWSFRYERNLRRSRWEGAENPFVTACKQEQTFV